MTTDKYILNANGEPVAEPDLIKWAQWLKKAERHVAVDQIGPVKVSTLFLGLDHNLNPRPNDPPVVWESMCFGGDLRGEMSRCAGSREQAEAMHRTMCERVREKIRDADLKNLGQ